MSTTYPQKYELLKDFSESLNSYKISKNTVKNYVSDLNTFFNWLDSLSRSNNFRVRTPLELIKVFGTGLSEDYKSFLIKTIKSENTINRHLASLRKFSCWLKESGLHNFDFAASLNYLRELNVSEEPLVDDFKKSLLKSYPSKNTAKNYASDIRNFLIWFASAPGTRNLDITSITPEMMKFYISFIKNKHTLKTSKRKVASLKRFFIWAKDSGKLENNPFDSPVLTESLDSLFKGNLKNSLKDDLLKENVISSSIHPHNPYPTLGIELENEQALKDSSTQFSLRTLLPIFLVSLLIISIAIGSIYNPEASFLTTQDTKSSQVPKSASDTKRGYAYSNPYGGSSPNNGFADRPSFESTESSSLILEKSANFDFQNYFKGYKKEESKGFAIGQQNVTYSGNWVNKPYLVVEGPTAAGSGNNIDSYYFLNISEANFDPQKEVPGDYYSLITEGSPLNAFQLANLPDTQPDTIFLSKTDSNYPYINSMGTSVDKDKSNDSGAFNQLSVQKITIFADPKKSDYQTAGISFVPGGTDGIIVNSSGVTDLSEIFITPTSPTDDKVLYVKEKGLGFFKVGFTKSIKTDVYFNWWVVDVEILPE